MKIAIASSGKDFDSLVDLRFGRCPYFLIINSETKEFKVIKNTAGQAPRGAGISAAQLVVDKGVGAVIAGNFGPNAINVLNSSGIKTFGGVSDMTVKDVLEQYKEGKLKENEMAGPSAGMNKGQGAGEGLSRGGGWGRGRR